MVGLGVVRLDLDAVAERLHRLVEVALPVVEPGELEHHIHAVGLHLSRASEHLLGFLDTAGVLVELGEAEVVVHVGRVELDDLLADRLGPVGLVQLLAPVEADEVLEAALLEDRPLAFTRRGVDGVVRELVVLLGLGQVRVVVGLPLARELERVVVRVGEVEVRVRTVFEVVLDRLLELLDGDSVVLLLVGTDPVLERHLRRHFPAGGQRKAQTGHGHEPDDGQPRRHCIYSLHAHSCGYSRTRNPGWPCASHEDRNGPEQLPVPIPGGEITASIKTAPASVKAAGGL